jgi:hypothetical protein
MKEKERPQENTLAEKNTENGKAMAEQLKSIKKTRRFSCTGNFHS